MPANVRAMYEEGRPAVEIDGQRGPADASRMAEARQAAPHLRPVPLGLRPSFGFGDRTGLATPGHVDAMQRAGQGISPIFAQQSIREMTRTERSPQQVMDAACFGALLAGWDGEAGADADHQKTPEDVDRTAAAGFTFFTIDPSDEVDGTADHADEPSLREAFAAAKDAAPWFETYRNTTVDLPTGTRLELSADACMRAAVKYGRAIQKAIHLADHIHRVQTAAGRDYEIELSVDETDQPTTLAEHYIIADQCRRAGMALVSLAPRYIGDFEKGVDFKGDVDALERSIRDHAAIAETLGPYKLSLHSGSDKLSMYPAFARATGGRFHVKTAGTSYLEALRVVARHDEALFRRICEHARRCYERDKASYHVSAELADVPPPEDLSDAEALERAYLERWDEVPEGKGFTRPGRQILHCTFGSVLTDATLGPAVLAVLRDHPETHREVLAEHFARHLQALQAGLR